MDFSINVDTLKKEVNLLQGVAEKKSGVAALSSLLIESTDTGIRLTGTDLDTTIQSEVTAEVTKEGAICVPAKKLCDIVRSMDSGTIKFKKEANDWVKVTCNTSKFRMQGMSKDQFPQIPEIEANEVIIDGETIKSMIKHTCFAVTQEESRFALNGAKIEIANGKAKMIATDGHRIALMEDDIDDIEAELDVLVPKRALVEITKFADNELVIKDSTNHIKFESGDRVLITRKLAMNFPNYEMAIPKNNDVEVAFDATEMVKALKRVAIMADERNRSCRLELLEDKMLLKATADGESEETVKCVVENYPEEGLTIHLNWQYLVEFLSTCTDPVFHLKNAMSAVEVVDGTSKYIVMPLRAA